MVAFPDSILPSRLRRSMMMGMEPMNIDHGKERERNGGYFLKTEQIV